MFAEFTKREFVETGIVGSTAIIVAYLAMMGVLNLIV